MAIFGAGGHVITTTAEHPAVLQAAAQLPSATFVPVDSLGVVDPQAVRAAIRPDTKLISVMHVNNELGVVQPIPEIARIAREAGVLFHSDGVQAAGKIPLDVQDLAVDLYSVSAHKIYGPKGMGALFVRKGVDMRPLMYGGPHERKMRAGTENVAGAAGFGRAAEWVIAESAAEAARETALRDRLEQGILSRVAGRSYQRRGRCARRQYFEHSFRRHRQRAAVDCARPQGFRGFERFRMFEWRDGAVACAGGDRAHPRAGAVERALFTGAVEYARADRRADRCRGSSGVASQKAGAGLCLSERLRSRCRAAWIARWLRVCSTARASASSA